MPSRISNAKLAKLRRQLSSGVGDIWSSIRQAENSLADLSSAIARAADLLRPPERKRRRAKKKPPVTVVIGTSPFMLTGERLLPGSIKSHHTGKVKR
jgi:hypothetical protein